MAHTKNAAILLFVNKFVGYLREKIAEACDVSPKDISFSQNDYSKWAAK